VSLRRVLVANRGEVAVRVERACRELGLESVAVYSTADAGSGHVSLADEAICIGPPPAPQSYLDVASIIAAGTTSGCDAVHPGWGFLAENSAFARACAENGLTFVGPRPETIDLMGDKVSARAAMNDVGVAGVPGSDGPVTLADAEAAAAEVGYPVLLKASAGGGGKGMRLVTSDDELPSAFELAGAEAVAAFGDGALYLEKALVGARHVEIQVLCDGRGGVLAVGDRECSIQRRHQKLIEEAPSPAVTPEMRQAMLDTAAQACRAIEYRGAGTLEFLVAGEGFYFIEMNTRLQVEHPITELVTGVDLVHGQLGVAGGASLAELGLESVDARGHAIEVRINAEDPSNNFMPSPGTLTAFKPPMGPGVRVDTHVSEGYEVPPFYDSLLAKVIVWAEDRPRALARATRALEELVIEGIPTTRELALDVIAHQAFVAGEYTTTFLDNAGTELSTLSAS
jgi:acetyl-CoA carboxylase biotin carboxylase subunit